MIPGFCFYNLGSTIPARVRTISLLGGVASLALALAIPLVAPANQQFELLMLTFWFAALGAVLFNTAGCYARTARLVWAKLALGAALAGIGLVTPYVRAQDTPDQRFYVMIALAPLALAGLILAWSSLPHVGRVSHAQPLPKPRRKVENRAARAPDNWLYKSMLPISLGVLFIAVIVVVITVIGPALLALLR